MPVAPMDGQTFFAEGPAIINAGVVNPKAVPAMTRTAVTVTSAQILALHTTAVTILPAPPTGFYINPLFAIVKYNFLVAYASSTGVLQFKLGTALLGPALLTLSTTNIAAAASSTEFVSFSTNGASVTAAPAQTAVTGALTLSFSSADATSGTGSLDVVVYYTVEPLT